MTPEKQKNKKQKTGMSTPFGLTVLKNHIVGCKSVKSTYD